MSISTHLLFVVIIYSNHSVRATVRAFHCGESPVTITPQGTLASRFLQLHYALCWLLACVQSRLPPPSAKIPSHVTSQRAHRRPPHLSARKCRVYLLRQQWIEDFALCCRLVPTTASLTWVYRKSHFFDCDIRQILKSARRALSP